MSEPDTDTEELLMTLAEDLESAAHEIENDNMRSAGNILWKASVHIQEELSEDAESETEETADSNANSVDSGT